MKRGAGILMPIFSLVSENKYSTFSDGYRFVDFLKKAKQKYWQVLPLNIPDDFGSPFCSKCIHSINPLFIDIDAYLNKKEIDSLKDKNLSYSEYKKIKYQLLFIAYKRNDFVNEIKSFNDENKWVIDFAKFMVLTDKYKDIKKFKKEYKNKDSLACKRFFNEHQDMINFYCFCQYLASKQWKQLKEYANENGILIIGDSPCNSAMNSKEAWNEKEMYLLDENLNPTFVAGVPPDYFSSEGQVWNTLIYNYDYLKKDNYKYLIDKYKYLLSIYDYLKIDHFRGLEYFYKIPFGKENGKEGEWVEGPGYPFIDLLKENKIDNLVLEDLGIISDGVIRLRDYSKYPSLKVYQFAFDEVNSHFLPDNYSENCVCYTGTHDNDTLYSFLENDDNRKKVCKYLGLNEMTNIKEVLKESIKKLYSSRADVVIITPQDLLFQGSEYRFNTPGTVNNNWTYKANKELYSKSNIEFLKSNVVSSIRE